MRLVKLSLKNIRSYEEQEIVFPEGSLLLSGEIGAGKTTILLAIEYALFGLQPGQKGSALLRNAAAYGEVALTIEVDGKEIIIERKLRRGNKSITNEYAAITIDGDKSETSITELKTKILDLIGYPQEFIKKNNLLYRYTVYTPQEEMKQIINEDPETRLNILRHIFGIDKYKRVRENLQIFLVSLREQIKMLQADLKSLDEDKVKVNLKKQFVSALTDRLREKQASSADSVIKRKTIEEELLDIEAKVKERDIFEKEIDKTRIVIGTKKERIVSINQDMSEIQENLTEFSESFEPAEYNKLLSTLAEKRMEIEALNKRFIEVTGSIQSTEEKIGDTTEKTARVFSMYFCPTCLQNVSEVHKHNIKNENEREINTSRKKLLGLKQEQNNLEESLKRARAERTELEENKTHLEIIRARITYIEQSRRKLDDLLKTKTSLDKDVSLLSEHIESMRENILQFSRFVNLLRMKQEELKQAVQEGHSIEISIAEVKKEIELTNREIEQMERDILVKEGKKTELASLSDLHEWLANQFTNLIEFTERNVLLKLRREFSVVFNSWFHILAGESFEVQLDETFTPLIMQGEIEMEYGFLSGGERTSIALAYRLALNQIINSVLSKIKTRDIVILDEPTDGFSEAQIDKMREVLEQLKAKQLIIVSHEQKIEGFVGHIMRLRKDGNISFVDVPQVK
jgi:exonuclease SbcC